LNRCFASDARHPDLGGCAICQAGPEIREFVLQARRAERSVRALAVAVGVSRSAMRWHLRDCAPAAFGLTRRDPSGPEVYSPRAVMDALARLEKRPTQTNAASRPRSGCFTPARDVDEPWVRERRPPRHDRASPLKRTNRWLSSAYSILTGIFFRLSINPCKRKTFGSPEYKTLSLDRSRS
jgi:hypothetical protein